MATASTPVKKATELKDLDVDRVDGVDKPATGRSFLLFKGEGGDQVMKGYGMVATAAAEVLKAVAADADMRCSFKSAVALNGLAQVLGGEPVFVGKSVPTQPYEFTEPDENKRGPADEKVGSNFVARSVDPASMVGTVKFAVKAAKAADCEPEDEDEGENEGKKKFPFKAKAKAKAKDEDMLDDDEEMADDERVSRGVMRSIERMAAAVEKNTAAIMKAVGSEPVEKSETEPKQRPRSRQIEDDEERQYVAKSVDSGYKSKFGVSFADTVFGKR